MSAWRRVALERFPERAGEMETASSVYDLLGELEVDLRAVYAGTRDEPDLPERAFAYTAWCHAPWQDPALRNAVAVGFYEPCPALRRGGATWRDGSRSARSRSFNHCSCRCFHALTTRH